MRPFSFFSAIALLLLISSCEKEEAEDSYLEEFVSLKADKDSLTVNQTTSIRAVAKGENLEYLWFSDAGVFVEYHSDHVVYSAPDCSRGNKEISCTIKASNRSETKKIYIYVY
jgi:hypothetical protein